MRQNEFITKRTPCQLLLKTVEAVRMLTLSKLTTLYWRLSLLALIIGPAVVKAQSVTVVREPSERKKRKKNHCLPVEESFFG